MTNSLHIFPEPKVLSVNCFFGPTKNPKALHLRNQQMFDIFARIMTIVIFWLNWRMVAALHVSNLQSRAHTGCLSVPCQSLLYVNIQSTAKSTEAGKTSKTKPWRAAGKSSLSPIKRGWKTLSPVNEDLMYVSVCAQMSTCCHHWHTWLGDLTWLTLCCFLHERNECCVVDIVSVILWCICYFNGYYTNNDLHNYMLQGCQRGWAGFVA